jgi:16S rRNA G1207 methylase RsmC
MSKNLPPEASAVQKQCYVTYTFSGYSSEEAPAITLLELRSVISISGTTGLRTWETALHFGSYLLSQGQHIIQGKRILELGAGTGLLSILCTKWLNAQHVTATDGDDGVVEALQSNAFLNGLQESDHFDSRSLKWGRALDEGESGKQKVVDVVIGADIVSNVLGELLWQQFGPAEHNESYD